MKLLTACLCSLTGTLSLSRAADLYVSPEGLDTWSGRHAEFAASRTDGPFATLERALANVDSWQRRQHPCTQPWV